MYSEQFEGGPSRVPSERAQDARPTIILEAGKPKVSDFDMKVFVNKYVGLE